MISLVSRQVKVIGVEKPKGCTMPQFKSLMRRLKMTSGTRNEIAGKLHEVKGRIKERVGQVTNDPNMDAEGFGEKIGGMIQKRVGQIKKIVARP